MTLKKLFSHTTIDSFEQRSTELGDLLTPFAYTDLLTKEAGIQQQPMLHFWEAERTVILGMKDTRLPQLSQALRVLKKADYRYVARNSGGLAVVADEGILNFSLIIPLPPEQKISIPEAYELMWQIMKEAFGDDQHTIEAKEISDSYCPGEYDLSINGRKFAGIAQRRIREGIAVMIYLSVTGPQTERGEMIRAFYQAGLEDDFGQHGYPPVRPAAMANLSDLLDRPLSVQAAKNQIKALFEHSFHSQLKDVSLETYVTDHHLADELAKNIEKMRRRNEDINQIGVEKR